MAAVPMAGINRLRYTECGRQIFDLYQMEKNEFPDNQNPGKKLFRPLAFLYRRGARYRDELGLTA